MDRVARRAALLNEATELAFAAYRPKAGSADELLQLLAEDVATLRSRGHVTERLAPVARTDNGEFLVVLEWSTRHAVDDAHADPEVRAVWERKARLADYIPPDSLGGADVPFARWALVADL
jgi:Antibiotic biosynthesis monooxygenase